MAHPYAGEPDARLSADPTLAPSRFRPRYRKLSEEELRSHDAIKERAAALEATIQQAFDHLSERQPVPGAAPSNADPQHVVVGRCRALAMTKLEEAVMWAIKGLTA